VAKSRLAIDGGERAVPALSPQPSKIGREELLEVLSLWELSPENRRRIVKIIEGDPHLKGRHLFRYYGPHPSKVAAAEQRFRRLIGVRHALAVNSCTSALIAAFRALGIGAGDEVIVPAYTFFATAAAVGTCNAIPIIADVDDTLTLDPADVERKIGPRTRAIAVVHMRGVPAQMDRILRIARRHHLAVVEDVAQAAMGSFRGRMLGSLGDIGCFSLDFYKLLTSGEGGFLTTDDAYLYMRAQSWHDCAACWRPDRYAAERTEGELFCGENYRMSELQGAVALAQIRRARRIVRAYRTAKRRIVRRLRLPASVQRRRLADPEGDTGVCIVLFLPDAERAQWALRALKAEGVPAGGIYDQTIKDWHIYTHWEHILEMKAVARDGLPWSGVPKKDRPRYAKDMCPQGLDYLSRAVTVAVQPGYSASDCAAIAHGVNKVLEAL